MDSLAAPFRTLFSKQARQAYLTTLLYIITSFTLLCVSVIAYWLFYQEYVPQIGLDQAIHLQFGHGPHPWGVASLGPELVSRQPYEVSVILELPRTPSNLAAGNFMIDLALMSRLAGTNDSAATIKSARRSAILTYASPLVDTANRLTQMPLYMVGWRREAETLQVQMMEQVEFARGWRNVPDSVRVEIQSEQRMQVYSTAVSFRAKLTGLRYIMYSWRITSFIVYSSMFWTVSMVSTSVVWLVLQSTVSRKRPDGHTMIKKEESSDDVSIKEETDEETTGRFSEPQTGQSHASMHSPIKTEDDKRSSREEPDDDDGTFQEPSFTSSHFTTGAETSLESSEASGLQGRRSHRTGEEL